MVPERALLLGAVALVLLSVVGAAVVPDAVEAPTDPERPSALDIEEVTIAAESVSGASVTLAVEAAVAHRGGPAENVTVRFRAIDLESGLLETSREVAVSAIRGDRERQVTGELTVPRSGGYRIETVVYHDDRRVATAAKAVSGVGTLRPAYAQTPVAFHESTTDQPVVEYSIVEAGGDRTTIRVQVYLTNTGDDPAGGLQLALKARQADSNIVAADADVVVGEIRPGRTVTPSAELTVPSEYNYYLDAQLWTDGVLVGSARSAANLDPTETVSVNETRRDVGLEVRDFERTPAERPRRETEAAETGGQPGFTAPLAAAAVLVAIGILARRRSP